MKKYEGNKRRKKLDEAVKKRFGSPDGITYEHKI